jgi:hypothetical protein
MNKQSEQGGMESHERVLFSTEIEAEKQLREHQARLLNTRNYPEVAQKLRIETYLGFGVCAQCSNQEPIEFSENGPSCAHDEMLLRCWGCQTVPYCSKECQAKDWASHKLVCSLLRDKRDTFKREMVLMRELHAAQSSFYGHYPRDPSTFSTRVFSSEEYAETALLNFSSEQEHMTSKEAVSYIVSAMGQFPHSMTVNFGAIKALYTIFEPRSDELNENIFNIQARDFLSEAGKLGVIDLLIFSMHTFTGNTLYQTASTSLLLLVLPGVKANAITAANAGILETLNRNVKANLKDENYIKTVLATTRNLCYDFPENQMIFDSLGGVSQLLMIMETYPTCEYILHQCLAALTYSYKIETRCSTATALAVVKVMNRLPSSARIQKFGCNALSNILLFTKFEDETMIAKVVEPIVACMKKFKDDVDIQTDACCTLIIIQGDERANLLFRGTGVVEAVANAFCSFALKDSYFGRTGMKALQRLAYDASHAMELQGRRDLSTALIYLYQASISKIRIRRMISRLLKQLGLYLSPRELSAGSMF